MAFRITDIKPISVGATAADVAVGCRAFIIQNTHATQSIYFREKSEDGAAVTSSNGFTLAPGATLTVPLVASVLSVLGSGATTTGAVMFLEEE